METKKPITAEEILNTPPTRWERMRGMYEGLPEFLQGMVLTAALIVYMFSIFFLCVLFRMEDDWIWVWAVPLVAIIIYSVLKYDDKGGSRPGSTMTGSGYFK